MRIVGGNLRGRTLATPKTQDIRPTTDRARESLFNILEHTFGNPVAGARVLDLFSGTGALGIEALSRGARFCLFVDEGVEARGLVRTNVDALGLQGCTKLFRRDATHLGVPGTMEPFDLMFADPPYAEGLGERALASAVSGGWLKPGALAVIEERASVDPAWPQGVAVADNRRMGDTRLHFLRVVSA